MGTKPAIDPRDPLVLAAQAEQVGIKLEIVAGQTSWEAFPSWRHQEAVDRIRATLPRRKNTTATGCACIHIADTYIAFADGSLKRPDIAVFCHAPLEAEKDSAVTLVPEAVIEVVSRGYEAKDMQLAPQFYLARGVKDVVIFDPDTQVVLHATRNGLRRLTSPSRISLECGCRVMV